MNNTYDNSNGLIFKSDFTTAIDKVIRNHVQSLTLVVRRARGEGKSRGGQSGKSEHTLPVVRHGGQVLSVSIKDSIKAREL